MHEMLLADKATLAAALYGLAAPQTAFGYVIALVSASTRSVNVVDLRCSCSIMLHEKKAERE